MQSTREVRAARLERAEVRAAGDGKALDFTGHAAVYDVRTWIGPPRWGWFEQVARGAAADVLEDDAAFLVNHDPNILLARNPSTLQLAEDATGLRTDAQWDAGDQDAQTWAGRVRRGDVSQMSFAFEVAEDSWDETDDGSAEVRTIVKLRRLWDVSLTTYGAYPTTDAAMRSAGVLDVLAQHRGVDPQLVRRAAAAGTLAQALDQRLPGRRQARRHLRDEIRALAGRIEGRALAAGDAKVLQQLLTRVAAADAVLDPIVEALEAADDALDSTQATLAALLGIENPDTDAAEDADDPEAGAIRSVTGADVARRLRYLNLRQRAHR